MDLVDVAWIEAAGNYARLHATSGTYLIRRTMRSLEQELDGGIFVRVRRSAIVNMRRVAHLELEDDGRYRIELEDGTSLHASRRCSASVRRYIEDHR